MIIFIHILKTYNTTCEINFNNCNNYDNYDNYDNSIKLFYK